MSTKKMSKKADKFSADSRLKELEDENEQLKQKTEDLSYLYEVSKAFCSEC